MANTLITFAEKKKKKKKSVSSFSYICSKTINVLKSILATSSNEFVINKLIELTIICTNEPRAQLFKVSLA